MTTKISKESQQAISEILKASGIEFYNSKKSKGTVVIRGDLVSEFVQRPDLLDLVDEGCLNIWSTEFKGRIFTFVQSREDMKARYRDFGLFQYNQRTTLSRLRELSKEIMPTEESHEDWYPWKFKYKLRNLDDYYSTQEWAEQRRRFYESKSKYARSCRSCNQSFDDDEQLFLNLHHKITIKNGGTNSVLNLVSLCAACHALVHYDKRLLLESLFIFFAETGNIGSEKIRRSLLQNDDVVTKFAPKSYLQLYDRFLERANRVEAKLYFFHKFQESFRYFRDRSLYTYGAYYFKASRHQSPTLQDSWPTEPLSSNESIYDLFVISTLIYSLTDRMSYFERKIAELMAKSKTEADKEKSKVIRKSIDAASRSLVNTKQELQHHLLRLKEFLGSGHLGPSTLLDISTLIDAKAPFAIGSFLEKDPYAKPNTPAKFAYYDSAIARRKSLLSELRVAFFLPNQSTDVNASPFVETLRHCAQEAGIMLASDNV